jgi:serine/threonine protein kinase
MDDLAGQRFGNYQLIRRLGRGGFADVYLGEHLHLKTQAALKFIHDELDASAVELFTKEAQTIAALRHPHIVRILEFGFERQQPFIVMDYAPNGALHRRHPRGSCLPLPTIISYVKQVASALAYVHANKLVHRDVKPENMLLDEHGNILLSDFGIVTSMHATTSLEIQECSGTVYYMAPEQIKGLPRSASDQYALATVVYEWICGTRPFSGSTFAEIVMKHLTESPPSLCEKASSLPLEVEQVVLKALAKDPQQRFPTIQDFSFALEQACSPSKTVDYSTIPVVDSTSLPTASSVQDQPGERKMEAASSQETDTPVDKTGLDFESTSHFSTDTNIMAPVTITNSLVKRFSHKKVPILVSLGLATCLIALSSWLLSFLISYANQERTPQLASGNMSTHQAVSSPDSTTFAVNTPTSSKPTTQSMSPTQPAPTTQLVSLTQPTSPTQPTSSTQPASTVQSVPTTQSVPTPTTDSTISLPAASCSSLGSLIEADGVYSGSSKVGELDVYYNSSTGDNCASFQSLGSARGELKKMFVTITACKQTTSGSTCTGGLKNGSSSDSGNYYYYAGPVGVYAKGRCINASGGMVWNGVTYSVSTSPAASHCS